MPPTPSDLAKKAPIPRHAGHPSDRRPLCGRDGCPRPRSDKVKFCSALCFRVAGQLKTAEDMCRQADSATAGELWASAVALSDALSEYWRTQHTVRKQLLRA